MIGMRNAVIASTGSYLPEKVVGNEDLTQFPREAIQMIGEKTGVFYRRVASDKECTSDLAAHAALVSMLRDLRPDAGEVAPAIYALPSYLSELIGPSGIAEIASQARALAGDDALVGALPQDAQYLLAALSVLDMPEMMTKLDKTAPGQGM